MEKNLQSYFPQIRTKEKILEEIHINPNYSELFHSWSKDQQTSFLDIASGTKCPPILSDAFFKEIMNPEAVPERLEDFLSAVLQKKIKILTALPNEEPDIEDNKSLLVVDILIQLEDGSLANVEIQKIGYKFPGERCACYSSDLILRQYKRIRSEKNKKFSYKDMKNVYTIVLFESSPAIFHSFSEHCIHHFHQQSDTGISINLLQEYILIPLDIFYEFHQNKEKDTLNKWLSFFSIRNTDDILHLVEAYPAFLPIFEDVYNLYLDMGRVINMYSSILREMDRNTVDLMIDEMQQTIDEQKSIISKKDAAISQKDSKIHEQAMALQAALRELEELKRQQNSN